MFSNRADVQIISFVGMTKDEFIASDYNNLLRAEFPEEYSSEPAGTIIRQTPKAGRTVKEKQRIVLTVSLGTQYVTIPEMKNMVAEDAEQTLKDMGLRVTKKPMVDNSVANGAVIYSQPAAGETVEGDTTVILYVSRSEISNQSSVPSLTGKTIEEARNEVKGLNLSIRTVEQASEQPASAPFWRSRPRPAPACANPAPSRWWSPPVCRRLWRRPHPTRLPLYMRMVPSTCRRVPGRAWTANTKYPAH